MKVKTVFYSKTYPVGVFWEKIGIECEIEVDEDARKALYDAKKTVESFHYESNKAAEKAEKQASEAVKPEMSLEDAINSCTELKVLETYKLIVRNNEKLNTIYRQKLIELSSNQ